LVHRFEPETKSFSYNSDHFYPKKVTGTNVARLDLRWGDKAIFLGKTGVTLGQIGSEQQDKVKGASYREAG